MRPVQIILISGLLVLLASIFSPIFLSSYKPKMPPALGVIKEFNLTDFENSQFSNKKLHRKVWLANFFFTNCGGICPFATANIRKIYRKFEENEGMRFVSITVDPERDGPSALKDYADTYGVDLNKWHFLTGSKEEIGKLSVEGFKLASDLENPSFHSEKIVLIDRSFQIRGYYSSMDEEEMAKLEKDIWRLLGERF